MSDLDVQVLPAQKKIRVETLKPPADGILNITVHIISINHSNTAFSKTKKSISFEVENAGSFFVNFDMIDHTKNIALANIRASSIHSIVISHFGSIATDVIGRVQGGQEPRLLTSLQNSTNPHFNVSLEFNYFVSCNVIGVPLKLMTNAKSFSS